MLWRTEAKLFVLCREWRNDGRWVGMVVWPGSEETNKRVRVGVIMWEVFPAKVMNHSQRDECNGKYWSASRKLWGFVRKRWQVRTRGRFSGIILPDESVETPETKRVTCRAWICRGRCLGISYTGGLDGEDRSIWVGLRRRWCTLQWRCKNTGKQWVWVTGKGLGAEKITLFTKWTKC